MGAKAIIAVEGKRDKGLVYTLIDGCRGYHRVIIAPLSWQLPFTHRQRIPGCFSSSHPCSLSRISHSLIVSIKTSRLHPWFAQKRKPKPFIKGSFPLFHQSSVTDASLQCVNKLEVDVSKGLLSQVFKYLNLHLFILTEQIPGDGHTSPIIFA